jgi:glycosyltransferase involved in cell wall biosynthesis
MVRAAAESCLAQRGEPLEIVLSDDGSSDGTFAILQSMAAAYRGPHQVRARRNAVNLGIGAHYNTLIEETSGELLVTAAGDDVSMPERVQKLTQAWDASGQRADLVASDFITMAPDGALRQRMATDDLSALTLESWLRRMPFTVGATHAFTRRSMQRFGPFIDGVCYEDRIMVLRALLGGGALTVSEPLVHYRAGGSSNPARIYTAEQALHRHRRYNRLRLAEVRQFMQDARGAGCGSLIESAFAKTLVEETYRRDMLDCAGTAARWRLLLGARDVRIGWRLRKFLGIALPAQAAWLRRWGERLNRLWRRPGL